MSRIFADYVSKARAILDANWTGASTRPAPSLYPHQWNWDSGFIAIGRSHYDTERASQELETLFEAQWANGMVPQIVFDPASLGHYFPEPDFWQTERCPHAPRVKLTSGITMPPVHAIAAEAVYRNARRRRPTLEFLERIYPKLLALHAYLYRERDPGEEGLVYIRHPWESGIDNSPTWDGPLARIAVDREALPAYRRRDLEHGVDPAMRPSDADYDRYVYLVDLFRRADYDEDSIRQECPFLVQDPLFNAVLCRADESLARIAEAIGADSSQPREWARRTSLAIQDKLWHREHRIFDAYDLVAEVAIEVDTAAGFLPLYAGAATQEQAGCLYDRLNSSSFCALHQGNCFTVPNYDTQGEEFDRSNYWRGPVWININWMLAQGLRRYGYTQKADSLNKDLLQLPIRFGFHEYFDSYDGIGYGTDGFSWTAALFIDLVHEFYAEPAAKPAVLDRVQAAFTTPEVLNAGGDRGGQEDDEPTSDLAASLMRSIRTLRDQFYDTSRGRVDYQALAGSDAYREYQELARSLHCFDPASLLGRKAKLAFWVNLYNSVVVDAIAALGVERSVKEVPEFFRRVSYEIGGQRFTPDDIEHGILRANTRPWFRARKPFGANDLRRAWIVTPLDPRVHFALVCGSRSCAPIEYYDPERIFEQFHEAARSFVNSSEVVVLPEQDKLLLSEIFRWYEKDFGGRVGVVDFIYDYLVDDGAREFLRERGSAAEIEYIYYDWNLNR